MSCFNFRNNKNKVIAVTTFTNLCFLPSVCASAINPRSGVRVTNPAVRTRNLSPISRAGSSSSSRSTLSTTPSIKRPKSSLSNSSLSSLNRRITQLETQRELEVQKSNHPFNKVVAATGIASSTMLVAGIVGGIAQQLKFRDLAELQAELDQKVQEDLTSKRYYFQEVEIPEAEQYIIDYYKENYGVDITKQ